MAESLHDDRAKHLPRVRASRQYNNK